jgi:hypothetical protein
MAAIGGGGVMRAVCGGGVVTSVEGVFLERPEVDAGADRQGGEERDDVMSAQSPATFLVVGGRHGAILAQRASRHAAR